jgi:hypothetical protein
VARLNQETNAVLERADVRAKLAGLGIEIAGSTPGALQKQLGEEVATWSKVIKDANIAREKAACSAPFRAPALPSTKNANLIESDPDFRRMEDVCCLVDASGCSSAAPIGAHGAELSHEAGARRGTLSAGIDAIGRSKRCSRPSRR